MTRESKYPLPLPRRSTKPSKITTRSPLPLERDLRRSATTPYALPNDDSPEPCTRTAPHPRTDTQAFKGIIEKAALWATDFRYVNDSGELVYTWAAFVDRLDELVEQPGDYSEAYRAQLEAITLMNVRDLKLFDDAMFVACFTELPDAVTQWTGYGDRGRGVALGFDSERVRSLNVPQYRHRRDGLRAMNAIVDGGPEASQEIEFKWPANLQKGDATRDRVVDGLIDTVQRRRDKNGVGPFSDKVANCVSQTHALVHRLPLVKTSAWEYEHEHRIHGAVDA